MAINLKKFEGRLYCSIDAAGMRGESKIEGIFELGDNFLCDYKIQNVNDSPLNNHAPASISGTQVKLNFRRGNDPWFRVDCKGLYNSEGEREYHYHLESGTNIFDNHILIGSVGTTSELISSIFDWAESITDWKFPYQKVENTKFTGFI